MFRKLSSYIRLHRVIANFLLAVCIQTATGVFSYAAMRETAIANERVMHTFQVIITLSNFERNYRSAELMRAIVSAGRGGERLKTALDAAIRDRDAEYERLVSLTFDNRSQQERLNKLGELLPADNTPGRFQNRVDGIRNLVQEMDDEEERLLNLRTSRFSSYHRLSQWFLVIAKLISFVLFGWCFYEQAIDIRRRRVAECALKQANDLLAEKLRAFTSNGN